MNRPLITIQCGNYSNYIGSHFWNLQESGFVYKDDNTPGVNQSEDLLEIDNDVLYREGVTNNKEVTYTPRLIAVDLKGSLGALPECGDLYGKITIPKEESLSLHWAGGHQVFREEPFVKNDFLTELEENSDNVLNEKDIDTDIEETDKDVPNNDSKLYNLEDSVRFWSDYLGARYHPRSILLCENFQHNNAMHPFDAWGLGRDVWTDSSNFGDNMEDRIRNYAEECDVLGGFQVVADYHDGFGGLSSCLMDLLSDEYNNKPVLSFPTSPAQFPSQNSAEGGALVAGACLSITKHLQSGLVSPLCLARDWFPLPGHVTTLPHVSYTCDSAYSSSAVLALALDTATLQYRRRSAGLTPSDVCSGLRTNGRNVATIAMELPMAMSPSVTQYFESKLLTNNIPLLPGISSGSNNSQCSYNSLVSIRGMKSSALFSKRSPMYKPCQDPASYIESCIMNTVPGCRPVCSFVTKPVMTGKPFPHIFNKNVNGFGEISQDYSRPENVGVTFTTSLTNWNVGPSSESSLKRLAERSSKLNLSKLHRLTETGVDSEEWMESLETLRQQIDNYSDENNY